jgi:hypothetical protein
MARLSPGRKDAALPRDALPVRRNSGEKAASAHDHKRGTAARTEL